MAIDTSNTSFKNAVAFVSGTGKHLFITGKAGTGKTTFLKYIREHSQKKMAVVAPTGVAAINAGGVTLHSFFQLPFGAFVPGPLHGWNGFESGINNRDTLLKNLRLPSAKRDVIKELELLVIDEVSMVRADLLDAVDTVLRHVRRKPHLPFGGVQMVYIGDLYQLPPVVNNTEWEILNQHYNSPFFFDSKAIQQAPPVYIELKKIYRQKDDAFINLLNSVRNNCCTHDDLQLLHQYYKPEFTVGQNEGYIILTSHNARADQVNQQELEKLPAKAEKFEAIITGDFPDKAYPVDRTLYLKVGAQVMFIKNDKGEQRRFYNGKLATISRIDGEDIYVTFPNEPEEMQLEHELWRNIRYHYNKEQDEVDEEEIGTFSQFPIRLAWAITIHKSQGLTFNKAVIDAGASFAPGQVYVALSRLTSIDGLVLLSKISSSSISTDNRVQHFAQLELPENEADSLLEKEQRVYTEQMLMTNFSFRKLLDELDALVQSYEERQFPGKETAEEWAASMATNASALEEVADKFIKKLTYLFASTSDGSYEQVSERTTAAATYFEKEIEEKLAKPLNKHLEEMKVKQKTKKYIKELQHLQLLVKRQQQQVKQAALLAQALHQKVDIVQVLERIVEDKKAVPPPVEVPKGRPAKGESARTSLQLFKEGKAIADIAEVRSLSPSTVMSHLSEFILTGEVDITDLVEAEKLDKILAVTTDDSTSSSIKEILGDDFSFGEIKAAKIFHDYQKAMKVS
ncbi:helix-turn-helix domain-containing protein [Aridibaculum aurantiacum]|uniref:helix-turn-helix domain-containing protein n=1 Tax=Aridibaculum aurantiacum TaxID=2810307 RepID=UPI001A96F73D|nr:helix-turn-helix domain-containing protein [Aridibaculum aurantiacum]